MTSWIMPEENSLWVVVFLSILVKSQRFSFLLEDHKSHDYAAILQEDTLNKKKCEMQPCISELILGSIH